MVQDRRTSKGGIGYLMTELRETANSITRAVFWDIPHNSGQEDMALKIGRYKKLPNGTEEPENLTPKSELTLNDEEFLNLIRFLEENYAPFRAHESHWITLGPQMTDADIQILQRLFTERNRWEVVDFVLDREIMSSEVVAALQYRVRERAVTELRHMLEGDLVESDWQRWFVANDWILGTDFVRILDDRRIDTENIADYLVEAHDGFLDVVEIKRPEGGLKFWAESKDRGNLVPSTDLVKAITQATNYLHQVEKQTDSLSFNRRLGASAVKPRATLVFGRSQFWGDEERIAYRILNRNYHALSILTYDHVLARAERVLGHLDSPSGAGK